MKPDARAARRPRKLVWITLALAAAALGLALRPLSSTLTPPEAAHVPAWFDAAFGLAGAGGMAWLARRLWRHGRRDARAARLALTGWAALMAGAALRMALFAQADYERGRVPLFVMAAAALAAMCGVLWRARMPAPDPAEHLPLPAEKTATPDVDKSGN